MNNKNRKTLEEIFKRPTVSNLSWKDIEALFSALGGEITEGSGSRIRVSLAGERAVFHRPHPKPTTENGAVESVRRFLENTGVDDVGV